MELNERDTHILGSLVEIYIETGDPVGSRTLAERCGISLSPASIRAIMADLTARGFLEQPHTSAGRVPTALAFRVYLDRLIHVVPLSPQDKQRILGEMQTVGPDVNDMLRQAGRLLSSLTRQISMVLTPLQDQSRLKRIEFIALSSSLVLVILVLQDGYIHKKVIHPEEAVSPDDLTKFANYLNEQFENKTVVEARQQVLADLKGARRELSEQLGRAMRLMQEAFDSFKERELILDGTMTVITSSGSRDLSDIRDLMQAVEDRTRLLDILDKIVEHGAVRVSLGREITLPARTEMGLIASPFSADAGAQGVVGVIGPMRMNYASLLPMVDYTARTITALIQKRF